MRVFNLCGVSLCHVSAVSLLAILSLTTQAQAHDGAPDKNYHPAYADGHAPIGVMADHSHKKGEWMAAVSAQTKSRQSKSRQRCQTVSQDCLASRRHYGLCQRG